MVLELLIRYFKVDVPYYRLPYVVREYAVRYRADKISRRGNGFPYLSFAQRKYNLRFCGGGVNRGCIDLYFRRCRDYKSDCFRKGKLYSYASAGKGRENPAYVHIYSGMFVLPCLLYQRHNAVFIRCYAWRKSGRHR